MDFNRPEILVYRTEYSYIKLMNEDTKTATAGLGYHHNLVDEFLIGKIQRTFGCSQSIRVIENQHGLMKFKYEIELEVCMKGFLVTSSPMNLPVRDLDKESTTFILDSYRKIEASQYEGNKSAGMIHRQFSSAMKHCLSHGGHYILDFPGGSTPD